MVQAHAIEAVVKCEDTLNFIRCDRCLEYVENRPSLVGYPHVPRVAIQVIGEGEDCSKVVRWMPPFRCQPRIVVIKPTDHASNVKGRLNRLQLPGRSRDTSSIGQGRVRHCRSEHFRTSAVRQCQNSTTDAIVQTKGRRAQCLGRKFRWRRDVRRDLFNHAVDRTAMRIVFPAIMKLR